MTSWISQFLCTNNDGFKFKKYGWRKELQDNRDEILGHDNFTFDSSHDLRDKCPDVYNQGKLGSCTANAIAAAYEFDMMKQEETPFVPSRLFIYYNEREMENTVNSDSGAEIRDGIKSINKVGIVNEVLWPYIISKFTEKPPTELYTKALEHRAVKYQRVIQDLNNLRKTISSGFPIVFGFSVYESFESEEVAKTGIMTMPKPDEKLLGGHAVMAVGYDDTTEVFVIRNSWGNEWGDKGYFYMPYKFIINSGLASDFWVVEKVRDD